MDDKPKPIFSEGLRFARPRTGAPSYIKGNLGIKVFEFKKFLDDHVGPDGWVNFDMKVSKKEGSPIYFQLNTYKKTESPYKKTEEVSTLTEEEKAYIKAMRGKSAPTPPSQEDIDIINAF